jgi:putative flippase GtrA
MYPFGLTEEDIYKFLRFCVVGVTGTALDFALTYIFKEVLKIQKYVANAISFAIAATSNYYFNRTWTFQSHSADYMSEYFRFLIVAIIGLGLSTLILYIVQTKFKQNFWISKVFATGIVLMWNFIGSKLFTFSAH